MKNLLSFVGELMYKLVVIVLAMVFLIISMKIFLNPEINTIKLTNIGFLAFLGISNVLFSWARSCSDSKQDEIKLIAIIALIGSVMFFIGSITKYAIGQELLNVRPNKNILDYVMYYLFQVFIHISFALAALIGYLTLYFIVIMAGKELVSIIRKPATDQVDNNVSV